MTTLDDIDRQLILGFLQLYKRGKRYYNLSQTQQKEIKRLIELLKDVQAPDGLMLGK